MMVNAALLTGQGGKWAEKKHEVKLMSAGKFSIILLKNLQCPTNLHQKIARNQHTNLI